MIGNVDKLSVNEGDLLGIRRAIQNLSRLMGGHAHTASEIVNVPAGTISAVNVQTALNELDGEKAAKVAGAVDGHFAGLNASGDLTDSGYSAASFVSSTLAYRSVFVGNSSAVAVASAAPTVPSATTDIMIGASATDRTALTLQHKQGATAPVFEVQNRDGTVNFACGPWNDSTGPRNNFYGWSAGRSNTTGGDNTFSGNLTGYNATIANHNTFMGSNVAPGIISGSYNVAIGSNSGFAASTTEKAIVIGKSASAGNSSVIVGYNTIDTTANNISIRSGDTQIGRGSTAGTFSPYYLIAGAGSGGSDYPVTSARFCGCGRLTGLPTASVGTASFARASNVATIVLASATGNFVPNGTITVAGLSDSSFNGNYYLTSNSGRLTLTYPNTGPDVGATPDTGGTVVGVRSLLINSSLTTIDPLAPVTIGTNAVTSKGLVIQGVASQSASLLETQASDGTALFSLGYNGGVTFASPLGTDGYGLKYYPQSSGGVPAQLALHWSGKFTVGGSQADTIAIFSVIGFTRDEVFDVAEWAPRKSLGFGSEGDGYTWTLIDEVWVPVRNGGNHLNLFCDSNDHASPSSVKVLFNSEEKAYPVIEFWGTGNVVMGYGAMATDAISGFIYHSGMAGPPTAVPDLYTGRYPRAYDSTNKQWYTYNSGWHLEGGTVTSVGLALPSIFGIVNSPITDSGNLEAELAAQAANTVFAGPEVSGTAAPTFRLLVPADIPALAASKIAAGTLDINRIPTGTTGSTVPFGNDARFSDARTPTTHASSHQSGGGDAIKLDDLSAPDDNTDLNATITAHGLLPKLPNDATKFLNGVGAFTVPAGGAGDVVGPASAVDSNFAGFDTTTGKLIKDSGSKAADFAVAAKGVTNGDSHDHSGGDGAQIDHTTCANIGSNSHAAIDTFIASKEAVYFSAYRNAAQTINAGAETVVAFDQLPLSSPSSLVNTSTGIFTVPSGKAGRYLIIGVVALSGLASGKSVTAGIAKNGTTVGQYGSVGSCAGSGANRSVVMAMLDLADGDTVRITGYNDDSSNRSVATGAVQTYFMGVRQ